MFGSVDPNISATTRLGPATRSRWGVLIPDLGERLRLGCVYELQSPATFGVLVTCSRPRSRGMTSHAVRARISIWWPTLAPSLRLVEARRSDRTSLGWEEFAARYWAELEAKPKTAYVGAVIQIGVWLRWVEVIVEREMDKIAAKCARYESRGMDERYTRVEQIEHRVRMLLGVFGAYGVLPLEFKPAYTVGDLLVQHLDDLEQEAEAKGGVQQVLADHFARVYKVNAAA